MIGCFLTAFLSSHHILLDIYSSANHSPKTHCAAGHCPSAAFFMNFAVLGESLSSGHRLRR
jgi:hypothetical protein